MHVRVDEARKNRMVGHIENFFCLILFIYSIQRYKIHNLASVNDHSYSRFKANALTLHRIKERGFYNHINFFHISLSLLCCKKQRIGIPPLLTNKYILCCCSGVSLACLPSNCFKDKQCDQKYDGCHCNTQSKLSGQSSE